MGMFGGRQAGGQHIMLDSCIHRIIYEYLVAIEHPLVLANQEDEA